MITQPSAMTLMRRHVNSARCAVIHHHRQTADTPAAHTPILAEELWRIIDEHRATARIYEHHDDPAEQKPWYTVVVHDDSDGRQEWFTTHPHPDPHAVATHPGIPLTDVLEQALHIIRRYPDLPRVVDVMCGGRVEGDPRITFQVGTGYTPATVTAMSVWAAAFDAAVRLDPEYSRVEARIVAPAADGGTPVAFTVSSFVSRDRIAALVAGFISYPGVTCTEKLVIVPGSLFAQVWQQAAEHAKRGEWPEIPAPGNEEAN